MEVEGWSLVKKALFLLDGTPYAGKLARTVWGGGKAGDCLKGLPITITLPVWLERRRESQLVRQSEADDSHGFRQADKERRASDYEARPALCLSNGDVFQKG